MPLLAAARPPTDTIKETEHGTKTESVPIIIHKSTIGLPLSVVFYFSVAISICAPMTVRALKQLHHAWACGNLKLPRVCADIKNPDGETAEHVNVTGCGLSNVLLDGVCL